jgi:cell division protein DivIC
MSAVRKKNVAKIQTSYAQEREFMELSTTKTRKLVIRRLAMFALFAATFSYFMVSTLLSQAAALEEKKVEKSQLEQDFSDLKQKQSMLKEEVIKLNDDEYIAKLARKDYFFSDKNEIIFNLPEEKKEKTSN